MLTDADSIENVDGQIKFLSSGFELNDFLQFRLDYLNQTVYEFIL